MLATEATTLSKYVIDHTIVCRTVVEYSTIALYGHSTVGTVLRSDRTTAELFLAHTVPTTILAPLVTNSRFVHYDSSSYQTGKVYAAACSCLISN